MARRSACATLAILSLLLAAHAPATAADDATTLAAAKQFVATLAADRKSKDRSALQRHLEKLPDIHNGIEDKSTRGKLQKGAGSLVKAKGLEKLGIPAIEALGKLNDSKGAYKQLKKHMPGPKDKTALTDHGAAVMVAVGKLAPDSAISALLELGEKSRDYDAAGLAIRALGSYKASKKRVVILESLIKLMSRFQPPRGQQVGVETEKRWKALGETLVHACNHITTRRETTPDAWLSLWKENKKTPVDLFNE